MIESSQLLQSYVAGIRHLCGAATVTLYVPAPLSGLSNPLLIHDGDAPPVPELADLETAERYAEETGVDGGDTTNPEFLLSTDPNASLIVLPTVHSLWSLPLLPRFEEKHPQTPGRRRGDTAKSETGLSPSAWIGLRFAKGTGSLAARLTARSLPQELQRDDDPAHWWNWLFTLGGALASHTTQVSAVLKDPVTGLPDRAGFQALLYEELEIARRTARPLSLLLINPDDFAPLNERFGREAGDEIIRQISDRLRSALRTSDAIARYGGVIFAAVLRDASVDEATTVAEKVLNQLSEAAFLDGAVRLSFSIGLALFEPGDAEIRHPLDLIRRTDQALNSAKREGGGRICDWEERSVIAETGAFDRLSGIFTANMSKDYRNMVLLWEAIHVIASYEEFENLASEVIDRLYTTFKPDRVGLYQRLADGTLRLVSGLTKRLDTGGTQQRVQTVELSDDQRQLIEEVIATAGSREIEHEVEDTVLGQPVQCYAVPLLVSKAAVGCLYLDGRAETLALDSSDLIFLKALASQVAVALDRARLSELDRNRREQESRELRAELKELRQALQQAKLVYRSPQMDRLMMTARRVAPTDATVLITGESGTGKELLARTIHELSPRRGQPMVIVDCGAIPTTLIDSELFGHEKGAYTGAQQRSIGRLTEANHGTVLLDEIGELPLEVQNKLLRFVQEKQLTSVGSTRPRRVDVRILAATNRDLANDVASGRFREDLYYRLNVIRLQVPPLRDRPDDVPHLTRHFLDSYAVQYQKNVRGISAQGEAAMMQHDWPGNIRELQNRLMQAVILCEADELQAADLGLPASLDSTREIVLAGLSTAPLESREPTAFATPATVESAPPMSRADLTERLAGALRRQIEAAEGAADPLLLPLGKWLADDLILEADAAAGKVARRAADILGLPDTTFRRRLRRAATHADAGLAARSGTWGEVRGLLGALARSDEFDGVARLDAAESLLLREILAVHPDNVRTGSALLGVTAPTYRRRVTSARTEA